MSAIVTARKSRQPTIRVKLAYRPARFPGSSPAIRGSERVHVIASSGLIDRDKRVNRCGSTVEFCIEIAGKRLHIVDGAPELSRPAYLIYPQVCVDVERTKLAIEGLHNVL